MRYQPIENHGIIGNMHSAALVSLNGSVDWLCLPRFDSPSVFGGDPRLVEALARAGRTDPRRLEEARLLFEQMLGYGNHLGLYAEQTRRSGEALGSFPQAFTHLAMISAASNLVRALAGLAN